LPSPPWSELFSGNEIPWGGGENLLPPTIADAPSSISKRFIPSQWSLIESGIHELVQAIQRSQVWRDLDNAYQAIHSRKTLLSELERTREYISNKIPEITQKSARSFDAYIQIEQEVQRLYSKRGERIVAYAQSFKAYEKLIERIYWVLSHIIMHRSIVRLSSGSSQQLQQVSLSYGESAHLTAVVHRWIMELEVGRLVHLTLVEGDGLFDGIYQVDHLYLSANISQPIRLLFSTRCLWYCDVATVEEGLKHMTSPLLVYPENVYSGPEFRMQIGGEDREFTTFDISKTMFL
jgi:predicted house-cleaning noncanonical NTP pyrophosphatase (MazG superfamily)